MAGTDIRKQVDLLLSETKTLTGVPEWTRGPRAGVEGQLRWSQALSISGEVTPMNILVDAYPRYGNPKFTIILEVGIAVTRVEYAVDATHFNGVKHRPPDISHGLIYGPHYHFWVDNRALASAKKLPKFLKYARHMPTNVRGFPNTFRWLCGEANIICQDDVPDLPPSDLLV